MTKVARTTGLWEIWTDENGTYPKLRIIADTAKEAIEDAKEHHGVWAHIVTKVIRAATVNIA